MKKSVKILALMLVLVMTVTALVSCSMYGTIKADFEEAGYTLQNPDEEKTGEIETEDGVITYTIHVFQKEAEDKDNVLGDLIGGIVEAASTATVWEFASDKDLAKAMEENADIKAILEEAGESDMVNGNCVLMTFNPEAVEIFGQSKK
ncbi:MAG: hypothetical protein J6W28_07365 [Clostridia bacterium]|nr:hypothetical protein [Clostridia bacterium]